MLPCRKVDEVLIRSLPDPHVLPDVEVDERVARDDLRDQIARLERQLAEALPEAHLQVVERTGHMLTQERPQLVVDALERLFAAATDAAAA